MVMLKGIPPILTPNLLKTLAEMGHGDEIVLADAHFPTSSICKQGPIEVRMDSCDIPTLLSAILLLLPLDEYVPKPVKLMEVTDLDKERGLSTPPVWNTYYDIIKRLEGKDKEAVQRVERFQFYEEAKRAYAVVHTGETSKYGNIILKKGLVQHPEK